MVQKLTEMSNQKVILNYFHCLTAFWMKRMESRNKGLGLNKAYKAQKDSMDSHRLTHEQKVELGLESEYPGEEKRNFVTNTNTFWSQGIVPYEISSAFSSSEKNIIETAIKEVADKTCVKFQPRANTNPSQLGHNTYIEFFSESGCWSYVGRVFSGKQQISLQKGGCVTNSITIHEMLHAIGQMHEQSRTDRDNYVAMLWNNIQGGQNNNNMAKENTLDNNRYDYESVLQYSLYAFSSNGLPTMEFSDRRLDFLANSADGLTFYDIKDITAAYQCTSGCSIKSCQNGGFQDHTCNCLCPDGLKGDLCEQVDTDSVCGGIIDVSGGPSTIQSPNYPSNYDVNTACTWLIKAGPNDYIKVDIDDLHLTDNGAGRCYHWLEVQYNLIGQTGPRRCGDVVGENYITSSAGQKNLMLLRFDSKFSSDRPSSKGFRLTVKAEGAGCANNPCLRGTCSATVGGGFTCACDQGFTGTTCNIPSVTASFSCTFQDQKCFLAQATDDQFEWTVASGSTPSSGTGPTSAQSGSNYLYAETSSPRVQGDVARMVSILSMPATARCLKFWYYMFGSNVGTLAVATSGTSLAKNSIWSLTGDQGASWKQVTLDIPSTDGLKVYFEATRGGGWQGDIAIDTVDLTPGSCSSSPQTTPPAPPTQAPPTQAPPTQAPTTRASTTPQDPCNPNPCNNGGACLINIGSGCLCTNGYAGQFCDLTVTEFYNCNFENSECFLRDSTNDNHNWILRSGPTPSSNTGPTRAHSLPNYLYYEVSSPVNPGETAKLESYNALPVQDHCLSFWYHMYGGSVGNLQISTVNSGVLWTKSSNQGDSWIQANVNLPADPNFQLVIEATSGSSWNGDIALDDIKLTNGTCALLPCDQATTCLNGGTCVAASNNAGFTCNCPPGFTGQTCDSTESVPCSTSQDPCMNGGICTLTGNVMTCTCVGGFTGQFCENPGTTLPPTTAAPGTTFTCTFESGTPCFLQQESLDTFDWTYPRSGSSPSSNTGPGGASEGSFYAFIEASSPRVKGDVAILMSNILPLEDFCLTFDYHMFGSTMGTLSVLINDYTATSTMSPVWSEFGDQGNVWHNAAVQIPATPSLRVFFEGIRGTGYTGDAAIDNIVMTPGSCGCAAQPCQNGGQCTEDSLGQVTCSCLQGFTGAFCESFDGTYSACSFEDNEACFLIQELNDNFDWTIVQGSTPSSNTGPSAAFDGNKYAFIEASNPRTQYDFADLYADLGANSAQRCLSFAYHMYGSNIGSLEVYHSDAQQLLNTWTMSGNQGDFWQTAAVQIPAMNNGQIYITGVRGNGFRGDIAIDDVELKTGKCGCLGMPCRNGGTCTASDNTLGFTCSCDSGYTGQVCENTDGTIPLTCTFEIGALCFMEQVNAGMDAFDWSIQTGGTPSSNTGPDDAHTGLKYAYIEASSPRQPGDNAIFSTEQQTFQPMDRCLRFYYHMKGSNMGTLMVLAGNRGQETQVWSKSGVQGDDWQYAQVDLSSVSDLVVAMEGVRGNGWSSDIAVDDIELSPGLC
ncbi:MAM and LDL-receptor class A domain-containing protein 1-like [Pecten maximus]|uniref:MAM and LDL-receptor class A domain-containing protein 1-like n=1 Tax=Pecten maximus TaxID=6579 RepID=UPI001458BE4C|nr:MAM and LDL-receptor class A domain-containing protein 1-like [Pecten maximus]XP_033726982.1 MAM and LDL-receptor class A domain-containing protein 1-like [Pecten maximus]